MSGQLVLYVGKTIQTLKRREVCHRKPTNTSSSKYIPNHIEWEIKLLEKCADDQGIVREQHYYDTLNPLYNKCRPGQTHAESVKKYNKTDKYKEYRRIYQSTEEYKAYRRIYFKEYNRRN